jgi:RNA polymerase sigma factor (sigma-70 family)
MQASDFELARRAAGGDRGAFASLARPAAPAVADLLRRMGASAHLADDVTQDALVAAYQAIGAYRGDAAFTSWVMRIAARLYLKRRRREARTLPMADPVDAGSAAPSPEHGVAEGLDHDRALRRLSAPERVCVSLCHGAGLTQAEIAAALRLPLGTVKSHTTRGLQKLRAMMTLGAGDPDHG